MTYSHRSDPNVPAFDDTGPRTVMDAHCALCARGAAWIARADKAHKFRIIPLQSHLGQALMTHYGMDPADPTSWLFLNNGQTHDGLRAVIAVGSALGGIWHLTKALHLMPPVAQNWAYTTVARNRIRWFGTADLCAMPDPAVQSRLLT